MQLRKRLMYGMSLVLMFALGSAIGAGAASQPGSDQDPLVTKSYVDQQIATLSAKVGSTAGTGTSTSGGSGVVTENKTVESLQADIGDLMHFVIDAITEVDGVKTRLNNLESGFSIVEVPAGKTLSLASGGEAILRTGKAVHAAGTYGTLLDVTAGADLKNGAAISAQHLLLSSRTDGRGFTAKDGKAVFLIRGTYAVK